MVDHIVNNYLNTESLNKWVNNYSFPSTHKPKLIGLISAGNIPLVSMHDLICILISGNAVQIKLSEKDTHLYNWIFSLIKEIDSNLYANIHIVHQLKIMMRLLQLVAPWLQINSNIIFNTNQISSGDIEIQ